MKKILSLSVWGILAALTAFPSFAQNAGNQPSAAGAATHSRPTIPVWPGIASGSEDWTFSERVTEGPGGSKVYSNVVNPTLTIYLPEKAKANGVALILCPGGAMRMLHYRCIQNPYQNS
jgi:hypothetical protein